MTSTDTRTLDTPILAARLRSLVSQLKRCLREQADIGDLTPSQTSALLRLERDGLQTLTVLARAEGIRPQSMGAIVSVLQTAGMVVGAPHPTDGRQILLSVTPACRSWIEAGRTARQDWLVSAIATRLGPDERMRLADALALLERLVVGNDRFPSRSG